MKMKMKLFWKLTLTLLCLFLFDFLQRPNPSQAASLQVHSSYPSFLLEETDEDRDDFLTESQSSSHALALLPPSIHSEDPLPKDSPSLASPSLLFFVADDGSVTAVNASDGREVWRFDSSDPIALRLSSSVSNIDPNLDLDLDLDLPHLDLDIDHPLQDSPALLHHEAQKDATPLFPMPHLSVPEIVAQSPYVDPRGLVYVGRKHTKMFAIDAASGRVVAQFLTSGHPQLPAGDRLFSGDVLFLARSDYQLSVFDSLSGQERWNISVGELVPTFPFPSAPEKPQTQGVSPVLSLSARDEAVISDAETGVALWRSPSAVVAVYAPHPALPGSRKLLWFSEHYPMPFPRENLHSALASLPQSAEGKQSIDYLLGYLPRAEDDQNNNNQNNNHSNPHHNMTDVAMLPFHALVLYRFSQIIGEIGWLWPAVFFIVVFSIFLFSYFYHSRDSKFSSSSSSSNIESKNPLLLTESTSTIIIPQSDQSNPDDPLLSSNLTLPSQEIIVSSSSTTSSSSSSSSSSSFHNKFAVSTSEVLGYGSHGTIVFKGTHHGREVAVKRILRSFYDVAEHEVALLLAADEHPNVVRYYAQEQDDEFVYLVISLCKHSLEQFVASPEFNPQSPSAVSLISELIAGVAHLHQLNVVHRDLKPQNVLLDALHHVKLSDMGLAKKLEFEQVSFSSCGGSGSVGWQAPELLARLQTLGTSVSSPDLVSPSHAIIPRGSVLPPSSSDASLRSPQQRLSLKIDIWALGCLLYYVLSKGSHPFGQSFEREANVRARKAPRLDALRADPVATDLIQWMLAYHPDDRPSTKQILAHPFFWNPYKRLLFIRDASDRLEIEKPHVPVVARLEARAYSVFGPEWRSRLPHELTEDLGKFRKYHFGRIRDLTRVIRNKLNHYRDLSDGLRSQLGDLPDGFLQYFQVRFPTLFLTLYDTIRRSPIHEESSFVEYFPPHSSGCPPEQPIQSQPALNPRSKKDHRKRYY